MLSNMATSLFQHKKIETTEAKAKELRPFVERLITKAKHALVNEKDGSLPSGQTVDIHSRRIVGRTIRDKAVLQELFDAIAPVVEVREGGYTRITKTGTRRGDGGRTAVIELVDWSEQADGRAALGRKKKKTVAPQRPGQAAKGTAKVAAKVEELQANVEESAAEAVEQIEAVAEAAPEAAAEAKAAE
jgi:large subunit ribosomal protein L17